MITREQATDHLKHVVDALNLLAQVAGGKAAHTAETVARVTKGVIAALSAQFKGIDVDVDQVLGELRASLEANDAAADAELATKFGRESVKP